MKLLSKKPEMFGLIPRATLPRPKKPTPSIPVVIFH